PNRGKKRDRQGWMARKEAKRKENKRAAPSREARIDSMKHLNKSLKHLNDSRLDTS
ncbi:unnamed protein product, partial [Pylaiella littoralis]